MEGTKRKYSDGDDDGMAQQQSKEPSRFDLEDLPYELQVKTCLVVEIITLLDASSRVPAIGRLLLDDLFWKRKLEYDFPELIEFVGTNLPAWIFPAPPSKSDSDSDSSSDSDKAEEVEANPWRRYYYVARYFMRVTYKALIDLAEKWAPICNRVVDNLPYCPYFIQGCKLVPKTTNMVSVFQKRRDPQTGLVARGAGSTVRSTMNIRTFCAKYLLYDVFFSNEYYNQLPWDSPWHYGRKPSQVNPIRVLMMQISAYEYLTQSDIFNRQVFLPSSFVLTPLSLSLLTKRSCFTKFFRERRLEKFMGWICKVQPVPDPRLDPTDSTYDGRELKILEDNVWTRGSDAPLPLPPIQTAEETTRILRSVNAYNLILSIEAAPRAVQGARLGQYDEGFLRMRATLMWMPRDRQGRLLIGGELDYDAPIEAADSLSKGGVVNLEDAALDNDTELHLPVVASKGMEVMVMAVKDGVPSETHPNTDQLIWIVDGSALLTLSGGSVGAKQSLHMEPGDTYLIPRGVTHQIQNTTPKDEERLLRIVTIYSPKKPE